MLNKSSLLLRSILGVLLLSHPVRTALGVLTGFVIYSFLKILAAYSETFDKVDLSIFHWLLIGVFFLQVKTIYRFMITHAEFDQSIERALQGIERAQETGLTKKQVQELHIEVVRKLIDRIESPDIEKKMRKKKRTNIGVRNTD